MPKAPRNFQATNPSRPAPKLVFYDADNKPLEISEYKGRGIVLNFWATWCAPCVKEMPDLDRLNALLKKEGIDVLALSVDRDALRLSKKFYKINEIRHMPILIDKNRHVANFVYFIKFLRQSQRIAVNGEGQYVNSFFLQQCIQPIKIRHFLDAGCAPRRPKI